MKITSTVLAASLALIPATAFAGDAKKEALAKAKEAAKEKAIEAAKAKSAAKLENAKEKAAANAAAAKADTKGADQAAANAEKETHARNLGAIERLQQIADATNNGDLKTLPVGLLAMQGRVLSDWPTLFAALTMAAIPMILLFLVGQRQFIRGLAEGFGKG